MAYTGANASFAAQSLVVIHERGIGPRRRGSEPERRGDRPGASPGGFGARVSATLVQRDGAAPGRGVEAGDDVRRGGTGHRQGRREGQMIGSGRGDWLREIG